MDPEIKRWMLRYHVMVRYDPSIGGGIYYYAPIPFGWLGWLSDRIGQYWVKVSSRFLWWGKDHGLFLRDWDESMMIPRCWQFVYSPFGLLNEWAFNTDRWWCREVRK